MGIELIRLHELSKVKTDLLDVVLQLRDDDSYTNDSAISDIMDVIRYIDMSTPNIDDVK